MALPPIPRWKIVTGVALVALLTAAVVTVLWWAGTRGLTGKELVTARLDALRVGLSIAVGGGGVFALYLAWRRQRSTEADLDNRERTLAHQLQVAADTKTHQERVAADTKAHQEQVAGDTRSDAEARRITDLYTKAVEQLGSDKAPVRLGGLYALERLAQDNLNQRQTIVNVLCAYLRMPYTLPGDPPAEDADDKLVTIHRERMQEREVRLAAQRILAHHLCPLDRQDPGETFWAHLDLDLTGATLVDFDLVGCTARSTRFDRATFTGNTDFDHAIFNNVGFAGAMFNGSVRFDNARFNGFTTFDNAKFNGYTTFNVVTFNGSAGFGHARFTGIAGFDYVTFVGNAVFVKATFAGEARFIGTTFTHSVNFAGATFNGSVSFTRVTLPTTRLAGPGTWPPWTHFASARFAQGVPPEVEGFVSSPDEDTAAANTH